MGGAVHFSGDGWGEWRKMKPGITNPFKGAGDNY